MTPAEHAARVEAGLASPEALYASPEARAAFYESVCAALADRDARIQELERERDEWKLRAGHLECCLIELSETHPGMSKWIQEQLEEGAAV